MRALLIFLFVCLCPTLWAKQCATIDAVEVRDVAQADATY